ncbi:tetratricopeptide repeat protein [Streptomyces sp. NBC_00316]|uniref:tetratricopeptide repeat protein n=1 Tax=Streptomyces sp. NBC_00316 TaxID=2975710 RepID=UPI002E2C844C|nr:tetratricopeptide repeat protein [Streptomyces sp. NBC_00316]
MSGDNARVIQLPPEALLPAAEVDAPPGLDDLPVRPGPFVGRTRELDCLDAVLTASGQVVVQAVAGLGGIGKSTLAAHWAATRARGHAPIRWISADSPAGVQQGLADLATALQPALAQALPLEALAERASQWLATHTGWLLILDNVNDPADIAPLLARATTGRILITSRLATAWHHATTVVRLDVLDPAESLDLLTRTLTAHGPRDLDGAADLCAELGHLPLAIEQVAAYLAQNPLTTPRAYLHLLSQYPADMYRQGAATTPAERTIARIWRLTLDRLTALQPLAADLLCVLAWYAPENIPATVLDGLAGPPALNHAIGLLNAYSMITADPASDTLAVHRLVQALARTPDPDDPHRTPAAIDQARNQAATQLSEACPAWNVPAAWPTWRTLLAHIDALTGHAAEATDTDTTANIHDHTGAFLDNQGQTARAISYFQRALTSRVRVLGADHPHTLSSRNNLAYAYRHAGDLGRAIELWERDLTHSVRVLGADHRGTLTSRLNLAGAYEEAGDLGRAIPLYEQNLAAMMRVLGADHPDTLTASSNLAGGYRSAGDLGRAIPLYEQNLAAMMRVLSADHPDTLTSRNNLADAYREAGDLGRAGPLFERNLEARLRVLGADHPDTLTSRNNLAGAYEAAGDLGRAIPLFEQTFEDRLRVLGANHPSTLTSRGNLAGAYEAAGDLGRAIPLFEQTFEDRLRVLGANHPDTLTSRGILAGAYLSAGDPDRAIPLNEETLEDRLRVLGADHPSTLTSRNNLAGAYQEAGDLGRAIPLFEQTLEDTVRVLGPHHPSTLSSRLNLAGAYEAAGDPGRAIPLYEQILADMTRVLGTGHPVTVEVRLMLAAAFASRDGGAEQP